jgi:muramidase (phage lysozyme)
LASLKNDPPLTAFLDLIATSEGTSRSPISRAGGYDVIVSGVDGRHVFTDYSRHPFAGGRQPILVRTAQPAEYKQDQITPSAPPVLIHGPIPALLSTASGRYQITWPTWRELTEKYKLGTFSPQCQDLAALYLLDECRATEHIRVHDIEGAIRAANNTWASFPGNLYAQPTHSVEYLLTEYKLLLTQQE